MTHKLALILVCLALAACTPAIPYPSADPNTPSRVYYGYEHLKSESAAPPDCPCLQQMQPEQKKDPHAHHGHDAHAPASAGVTDHYAAVMVKMHRDMAIAPTGDVDVDFMRGMIPHHQGAIDMAEIVLRDGKDPYVRRLAMDILVGQHREIAYMQYWLHNRKFPNSNIGLRRAE